MLDQKVESFIALHKDPIRDLAFNPVRQDQLLSGGQDKCVKLTNVSSCAEIQKYPLDSEAWAVCWNADDCSQFFVGTKRSKILLFDTRESGLEPVKVSLSTCVPII
jgi:WD40 repeat protein